MKTVQRRASAGLLFALLVPACRSTEPPATALGPVDADDRHETVWGYLAAKYDADRDGVIRPGEYDRGAFERLDRNADGVIDATDFVKVDPEVAARAGRAQQLVAWYFQVDEDPNRLDRAELEQAFDTYDLGDDGLLDGEEFGCAAEERRELGARPATRRTRELDAFALLLEQNDTDADGLLARGELTAFFDERDDGDGIWQLGRRQRSSAEASDRSERPAGARVGEAAPDFSLEPPEGGEAVTLSDFAGDRPVALIFGSYT